MTQTFVEAMEVAKAEVAQHLPQCCEEILHWHDTGILIDGYVRSIAAKLLPFETSHHLGIIEAMINSQAMHQVVAQDKIGKEGSDGL